DQKQITDINFEGNEYQEKDKIKSKLDKTRARDWKKHEKTESEGQQIKVTVALSLSLHFTFTGQASTMGKINQVHTLLEGIFDITNTPISYAGNPQLCDWLLRRGT
ncbi:hypothetical protein Tco_0357331, partial [Tanacetum coccineum]